MEAFHNQTIKDAKRRSDVWRSLGEDCAILALKDKEALFSVAQFTFHGPDMALYGIHGAVNQLAARGLSLIHI